MSISRGALLKRQQPTGEPCYADVRNRGTLLKTGSQQGSPVEAAGLPSWESRGPVLGQQGCPTEGSMAARAHDALILSLYEGTGAG